MTEVEIAWLAGLFEGEGYVTINARTLSMGITMTDLDVLQKVQQVTGCGSLLPRRVYSEKHTQTHSWRVSNLPQAQEIARAIYPHMGARRRAKLDEVLARRLKNRGYRADERGKTTTEPCARPGCTNVIKRQAHLRRLYPLAFCSRACRGNGRLGRVA